ncbi:membrane protein [Lentimicrobium sp.]
METKFNFTKKFQYIALGMAALGLIVIVISFFTDPARAWANLLLNNYMFLSIAIGASFFIAIQYITQSGWSAMFKRVGEALSAYIPYAGIVMLLVFFGMHALYHWSHYSPGLGTDMLLEHKSPYLNVPFFFIRMVLFFIVWMVMIKLMRKASLAEDEQGGLYFFERSELLSKIYIFILALTFSLATFDWIMSIEPHWFSTIFSLKNFVAAFQHGSAMIALVVIILHQKGYFKDLNKSHLLDFSRYIFILSIIWGYFGFSQFMLIWYGNIPEETEYFYFRWHSGFKEIFYINFLINWFIPFVFLLPQVLNKNIKVVMTICILLIAGQYIDLYEQIFPGVVHAPVFGLPEIGFFVGFAGIFLFIFGKTLASAPLIPQNHPYLQESVQHHVH